MATGLMPDAARDIPDEGRMPVPVPIVNQSGVMHAKPTFAESHGTRT